MNTTTKQSAPDNRVTTYVDKLVQGTLVRQIIIHWVAFVVATAIASGVLTWMVDPFVSRSELFGRVTYRLWPIFITALFMVPLFVRDTVKFSHRMVGPMVRVRRELKKLSEGKKAQRMEFRPHDYWQDVATEFNEMCDFAEPHISN